MTGLILHYRWIAHLPKNYPCYYPHVKDNIPAESLKERLIFAATTDLWSNENCHPYLTFGGHFISTN